MRCCVTALAFVWPLIARAEDPRGPAPVPSIATSLPGGGDPYGNRAALAATGVTYGLNYIGEVFDVTSGGLSRGATFNGRVEGYTDIDLGKVAGWQGAVFHTNFWYIHGIGPNTKHAGALLSVSSVEALETVRLDEMWIEQALLGGMLKARFGELAADTQFYQSDTAAAFFNGAFGWPVISGANLVHGGPAYPLAIPGVSVQFLPSENFTLLAAIYNGSPVDPRAASAQRDNRHGLDFRLEDPPLVMLEGKISTQLALPGFIKLGGWHEFGDFADKRSGALIEGNHSLYAMIDQRIWKGGEGQGINVFGRVMGAPDKQNRIDFYADAGIVVTGLVPNRPNDSFGAAFGYASISDRVRAANRDALLPIIHDHEAVLEINYRGEIIPGWVVMPDFQYIWHPGGHVEDPSHPGVAVQDAAVIGARTTINY